MTAVVRAARAFPSMLRIGLAEMVAYRSELVIWILTASMPIVMMLVWDRVSEGASIGGYDQAAFARYFTCTLIVRHLSTSWVVWEMNESIRTGRMSSALMRPMSPLVFHAAENLAAFPFRVLVLVPLIALIAWWRPSMGIGIEAVELPMFVVSLALAWGINFSTQVAFGSLAFVWHQSLGLFQMFFGLFAIFSGYLVPVRLMPASVAGALEVLPFRAMLGTPVEIAAGQLAGLDAIGAIGMQVGWLFVAVVIARFAWRRGVRRYEAFGS